MIRHAAVFALGALAAGCQEPNPLFCQGHPGAEGCSGGDDAPQVPCDDTHPCATGVCNNNVCVECVSDATCSGTKPICDMQAHSCGPCTSHAQCASSSNACLPDGSCAEATEVAYVTKGGPGTSAMGCTKDMPCPQLSDALATPKTIIKIVGADPIIAPTTQTISGAKRTILADKDAEITAGNSNFNLLAISGDVEIYDLKISGVQKTAGMPLVHGVLVSTGTVRIEHCNITGNTGGDGIHVVGGKLTLTRSTLSGNGKNVGVANAGGLSVSNAGFEVTNNFIFDNGGIGSRYGGVDIGSAQDANVFEFNSIAFNKSNDNGGAGIDCNGSAGFTVRNNVVWGNTDANSLNDAIQVRTVGCAMDHNQTGPEPAIAGNTTLADPKFIDGPNGNLRLKTDSPVKGQASGTTFPADMAVDIDGQPRPQPAGMPADVGADEIP